MSFLTLSNIHKTYANQSLLRGVSFDVEQGRITCLLGASGSGKTTLLRIIAGLETATEGHIILDGTDITSTPTHQRGIGLMFQDYALFPHKTVSQNVAFGLGGKKRITNRALRIKIALRVEEMLALVGLADLSHRDVNALSGGERQRVALARSLAPQPRLLLLDEPLGALDRNLRERLLEEFPSILRQVGVTAITVTHDQEEAFALADHVVLLNEGRVIQSGTPQHVYDHPPNMWAARFLGLNNLLPQDALRELPSPRSSNQTMLIHPWGIHLNASSGGVTPRTKPSPCPPDVRHFTGTVTRCTFHGPIYQLTVNTPAGDLHFTRHPGQHIPAAGDSVTGWIDPAALRELNS